MTQIMKFTVRTYDSSFTYTRVDGVWYVKSSIYVSAGWRRDDDEGSTFQRGSIIDADKISGIILKEQLERAEAGVKKFRPAAARLKAEKEARIELQRKQVKDAEQYLGPLVPQGVKLTVCSESLFLRSDVEYTFQSFSEKIDYSIGETEVKRVFHKILAELEAFLQKQRELEEQSKIRRRQRIQDILDGKQPVCYVDDAQFFLDKGSVHVPEYAMGMLIGRGGESIKDAQESLGIKIFIKAIKGMSVPKRFRCKWAV